MTFSERKHTTLRREKELKASTFFIALFAAAALFVPYIIMGKGYFIFFGDFNVQQIPFYKLCHAAVRSGNLGWSFTTDLGSNFIGSYSFYLLGSPFFWLTIPFPNYVVPYLMGPLLILKFACAALTAYLYIRRFTRTPATARLGGLLYAFSGFSVYNIFFNHFHEAIIVFPLLLLSMELLITENRRGVFALTVALCAITNYFFFFGMAVFCIIYYVVKLSTGEYRFRFSAFLWLAFEAVLGILMAAGLLVPSVMAILGNSRVSNLQLGWHAVMYGREQIYLNIIECFFFPPDLPARPVFFPGANVKWSSLGGWLPVAGMTGVISWFISRKKTWIKRLLVICIFMSMVPVLNSLFYALNSSYYARWFYMPILIMALATARIFEEPDTDIMQGFRWSAGITAGIALTIGLYPRENSEGKIVLGLFTDSDTPDYLARYWVTVAIAVLSLVLLGVTYAVFKKDRKKFVRAITVCVCAVSIIYGNFFIALGRSHSYDIESVMINSLIEGNVKLDGDKDTFRIDTYDCVDNTAMYLGYSSINAFHSIVPPSVMEFYKYIGITRDVGSRPDTSYPALRPLLSVRYLLDRVGDSSFVKEDKETAMPGYNYIKTADGYYVYENENYVPYGFSYDYAMNYDFCDKYDGKAKTRLMLKAILLTKEQMKKYADCFTDLSSLEAVTLPATDEHPISDAALPDASGVSDVSLTDTSAENSTDSAVSDVSSENGGSNIDTSSAAAERDTQKTTLSLTDEEMALDCAKLKETAAKSFKSDKNGFTATVERDKKTLVFFSVPYDKGWTATVNGAPAEIERVNEGFMAVCVNSGSSTIRFDYETPGLNLGLMVTGGAFIIFLIYFITSAAVTKKRPSDISYPEGDALIKQWYETEAAEEEPDTEENLPKSFLDGLTGIGSVPHERTDDIKGGFKIDDDIFKEE